MTTGVQDNRDFYRIQDVAFLEFEEIDPEQIKSGRVIFPLEVSPQFQLLNKLHTIDSEHSALLKVIGGNNRDIAAYLKSINEKIELLAHSVVEYSEAIDNLALQEITLSEGGLSFTSARALSLDTYLALKVVLLPSYVGLLLIGRVVNCNEHISGDFLINLIFENLLDNDRQLIARHVLQHQAKQRRESITGKDKETDQP